MPSKTSGRGVFALIVGVSVATLADVTMAQQGPMAAMFADDQKRAPALALSFATVEIPATKTAGAPLQVYLSAGDLQRAFDRSEFRPDAAIVPTNTDLQLTAPQPGTQRVLVDRVAKQPDVMRVLERQVAARRKQAPGPSRGEPGVLRIGVDTFVAQLAPPGGVPGQGAFPKSACFVATDFATSDAVDRRELFVQDRMRQGIAACLAALDAAGARSVVVPLLGAASSARQASDAMYEGQRVLKECRLLNSTAGIALGIHDFASRRRNLREIGLVQWDQEVTDMFRVPAGSSAEQSAQAACRAYTEQVKYVFQTALSGRKITPGDLNGSCGEILNGR